MQVCSNISIALGLWFAIILVRGVKIIAPVGKVAVCGLGDMGVQVTPKNSLIVQPIK